MLAIAIAIIVAADKGVASTPAGRLATTNLVGARPAVTTQDPTPSPVVYKDVVGFPGYRVGDDGSVWSCMYRCRVRPDRWRPLKLFDNAYGYKIVMPRRDGKNHTLAVHRVVLQAFVGPCPEGHEACHNNGDKTDNRPCNLRWATRKENIADREFHGTNPKGTRNGSAKLDDEKVRTIRTMRAAGYEMKAIAARFGVARDTVGKIIRHEAWVHV